MRAWTEISRPYIFHLFLYFLQNWRLTKKLAEMGRLIEVSVLDHLIITPDHYYSFADEGER
ncbi:JAB domain-containing protein [Algoriphagus lacus]|nr:JAB domain-containing protein [Algoriphagus lacus]